MKCQFKFLILLYFISFCFNSDLSFKDKYNRLLDKNYKSDIEYIFNPSFDFYKNNTNDESIRKHFHKFKENEMYLYNGAKMKCFTPIKIKKNLNSHYMNLIDNQNKIENVSNDLAKLLLADSSKLCYNSNFKEWFYKLCPTKSANQVLTYKKKDEKTGEEFQESWSLGYKIEEEKELSKEEIYVKWTNDTKSQNLEKNPYVIIQDRIAKIYNTDLSNLKKFELGLVIDYKLEELQKLNKTVIVNKYVKSIEDYLKDHPDAKTIPIQRRILKLVNKHLVILDGAFPIDKSTHTVNINIIKQRTNLDVNTSFNLMVYGEYVFCFRCEFLNFYNIGDSLFIKNGRYSEALKNSFKGVAYKSRRIISILDNQLLKVEKQFPKDFQGPVLRSKYFIFDSINKKTSWINLKGNFKVKGNLLIGSNSKFKSQIMKGDKLFFFNVNKIQENFNSVNTNPKIKFTQDSYYIVDKVLSNNLLLTKTPMKKHLGFKGDIFIGKNFYEYDISYYKPKKVDKILRVIDFDAIETLSISQNYKNYYSQQFLFHPGFILRKENDTVFRMKFEKILNQKSKIRILLGTDLNFYKNMTENVSNDYEILFNSDSGAMIKKVETNSQFSDVEFYATEIRTFFQEKIQIDLIFHNNSIYLNTIDDDFDSSIKIKYSLPENISIKYIYFDLYNSDNVNIKDFRKMNFIELKYLINIFIFNQKLLLTSNAFYTEEFTGGDYCTDTGKFRKSVIEYRCDISGIYDIYIENVIEERTCEYKYFVRSRNFCNPIDIMLNKIEKTIAKTKCVIQNKNYNHDNKIYFRNAAI